MRDVGTGSNYHTVITYRLHQVKLSRYGKFAASDPELVKITVPLLIFFTLESTMARHIITKVWTAN